MEWQPWSFLQYRVNGMLELLSMPHLHRLRRLFAWTFKEPENTRKAATADEFVLPEIRQVRRRTATSEEQHQGRQGCWRKPLRKSRREQTGQDADLLSSRLTGTMAARTEFRPDSRMPLGDPRFKLLSKDHGQEYQFHIHSEAIRVV